jgi:general secretion pathway protein K
VALVLVLGSLTILAVMLTEFQDETSADFGHALSERDGIKAEYAAKSGINLTRLLIAAEPTIRKAVAPLFIMMRRGPPQIPVWEFADSVLGAFNDQYGAERFAMLSGGANVAEGENLGLEGAGFEVVVVDEDSKINFNAAAKGDAFSQQRLAIQILGLLSGQQYNPLFEERDAEGQFNSREQICSAIVDWTDPDQDNFSCDLSGQFAAAGGEDSFYQMLDDPYERKNAAFDSLQELHLVRGISDDFWSAFVEPDPLNPRKRVATVWGQGKVNVNTANPQTLLAIICGSAVEGTPLCFDEVEQAKFLSVVGLIQGAVAGAPVFSSPKGFVNALKGKGMFGSVMTFLEMEPIQFRSEDELQKAISTESKVFSIYSTGITEAGTRTTVRRIHAVVDFRGAPKPPDLSDLFGEGAEDISAEAAREAQLGALPKPALPEGASEETLEGAFRPDPAGRIIYYRNQ